LMAAEGSVAEPQPRRGARAATAAQIGRRMRGRESGARLSAGCRSTSTAVKFLGTHGPGRLYETAIW
jgi:hypothetical protein